MLDIGGDDMSFTITIRGDRETIASLTLMQPERTVDLVLRQAAQEMAARLARYPRPPASSTYVRTGTLRQAWRSTGASLHYVVGNNVRYATYVQGSDQAWMHRGRWETAEQAAIAAAEQIARDSGQAMVTAFAR